MAPSKDAMQAAIAFIRGQEVADLQIQNRNLIEENHRLRSSEGKFLEERGRILGFFDLKKDDDRPRDIVWLIRETVEKSQLAIQHAEVRMLERIAASLETGGQGIDSRIGAAVDKLKQDSYDRGWNDGCDKVGKTLTIFFDALQRRLR